MQPGIWGEIKKGRWMVLYCTVCVFSYCASLRQLERVHSIMFHSLNFKLKSVVLATNRAGCM